MQNDIEVIRRVLAGDTDSFRFLVARYEGMVFRLVRNLIAGGHECEDLAQDVFLAAYVNLGSYDAERGAFSSWLMAVARNRRINSLKRFSPVSRDGASGCPEARASEIPAVDSELFELLDKALAALPVEQKTAFVLSEFCDMSQEQISEVERVNLGTVKSRISRAKAKLRGALNRLVEET